MKNLMFLIFSIILLSCNTFTLREDIKFFVDDIVENPEKLKNMGKYYPIFYDDNLSNLFMKDSLVNANLIKFIKDTFSINRNYIFHKNRSDVNDILGYRNYKFYKNNFSKVIGIYSFFIVNGNDDYLIFYFAILNQQDLVLFDIWYYKNFSTNFYP